MEITEENKYDWIEKYLNKELNKAELKYFEHFLGQNPDFETEVALQHKAHNTLKIVLQENKLRHTAEQILQNNSNFIQQIIDNHDINNTPKYPYNFFWWFGSLLFVFLFIGIFIFWLNNPIDTKKSKKTISEKQDSSESKIINSFAKDIKNHKLDSVQFNKKQVTDNQAINKKAISYLDSIPELILKKTKGYVGSSDIVRRNRLVLIYQKTPTELIDNHSINYLLRDTLNWYGAFDRLNTKLIYEEFNGKYKLLIKQDTFLLRWNPKRWQKLPKP